MLVCIENYAVNTSKYLQYIEITYMPILKRKYSPHICLLCIAICQTKRGSFSPILATIIAITSHLGLLSAMQWSIFNNVKLLWTFRKVSKSIITLGINCSFREIKTEKKSNCIGFNKYDLFIHSYSLFLNLTYTSEKNAALECYLL